MKTPERPVPCPAKTDGTGSCILDKAAVGPEGGVLTKRRAGVRWWETAPLGPGDDGRKVAVDQLERGQKDLKKASGCAAGCFTTNALLSTSVISQAPRS